MAPQNKNIYNISAFKPNDGLTMNYIIATKIPTANNTKRVFFIFVPSGLFDIA